MKKTNKKVRVTATGKIEPVIENEEGIFGIESNSKFVALEKPENEGGGDAFGYTPYEDKKETPEDMVAKSIAMQDKTIEESKAEESKTPVADEFKKAFKPANGLKTIEGEVLKVWTYEGATKMHYITMCGFDGDFSGFGSPPKDIVEGCVARIGYVEKPSPDGSKIYYNIKEIAKIRDAPIEAAKVAKDAVAGAAIVDPNKQVIQNTPNQQRPDDSLEIVPSGGGFLSPACTIQEAIDAFKVFEEAKAQILDAKKDVIWIGKDGRPTNPSDYSHPHIKRSGWRKLARFFGLSWTIVQREKIILESGYMWIATARVTHPRGSVVEQDGATSSNDPFFTKGGRKQADEEDVLMKAETVALNRAISDLLGSGECSAEEMD